MSEEIQPNPNDGRVILIDKPLNWTSFDVVKKLRYALKVKKIGHAGTLDPLATGLLILCTGKKTKSIEQYQAQKKEYTGRITFGSTTASYDLETEPEFKADISHLTEIAIQNAANEFLGEIEQTPPIFSAVKKDGKRAYELARAGKEVKLKSKIVTVDAFEVFDFDPPHINFRIACSKGTYIRSLANDIGEKLNVGAYLSALKRTKIGEFSLTEASELNDFIARNKIER